jgi:hypothetical protein
MTISIHDNCSTYWSFRSTLLVIISLLFTQLGYIQCLIALLSIYTRIITTFSFMYTSKL